MSRSNKFRSISKLVSLFFSLTFAPEAFASACPTPAVRPDVTSLTLIKRLRALDPYKITEAVAHHYDARFGLGMLEVLKGKDEHYSDWMFEVELPLWSAPDAKYPAGWILRGQVYTDTGVETLTGAGMVETDYEHESFIVWDTQTDWLKLQLTNGLHAWTHRCHLELPKAKLKLVTWQAFFRRNADWLHFRKPVPHVLRKSPGVDSVRVTTIGLDHKLVLLDIRGDWMEVEVEQPDLTCDGSDSDENRSTQHRGWVKWRDERGPWVYIYTRGC
jgi:hypothetical protein